MVATNRSRTLVSRAVLALLGALATGAALLWFVGAPAVVPASTPTLPAPGIAQLPARPVESRLGSFSAAEARAYALLGQLDDHRIPKLPALDAETLAALPRARDLLGHQHQLAGGGTPTRVAGGTMAISQPGGQSVPATGVVGAGAVDVASASRGRPAAAEADPTGAGAAIAAGPIAHDLGQQVRTGGVALTAHGQQITGEGTWAAMHYVPGRDPDPVISDHGQGGYAIALFPEDPSSTRLNGGLIVPGRFYQVTGDMRVTGGAPIDVHVRPLSAVPMFAPVPCLPPAANG